MWSYVIFTHDALVRIIYLHRRGAFSVARFDLQGIEKALTRGTSRGLTPRFFVFTKINILLYYTRLNDRSDKYEQIRAYSHYIIV